LPKIGSTGEAPATEIDRIMKQFYKPALLLLATYALSALSIWSHG
jgi:hypothetical protein